MKVKELQELYHKDKKQFLKLYSKGLNMKITSAEFYQSEDHFKKLEDSIDDYFGSDGKYTIDGITIEKDIMRSVIVNPKSTILKIHDSITISLPCESHIRFCPYKNESIEISRVLVGFKERRKNKGSQLMTILDDFIQDILGFIPEMYLECTGSIGFEILNSTTVKVQTAFFRKHGFKVNDGKHYPRYVSMTRPKQIKNNNIL
jgi:hypothetical protein